MIKLDRKRSDNLMKRRRKQPIVEMDISADMLEAGSTMVAARPAGRMLRIRPIDAADEQGC
jgi:hypothetical protein